MRARARKGPSRSASASLERRPSGITGAPERRPRGARAGAFPRVAFDRRPSIARPALPRSTSTRPHVSQSPQPWGDGAWPRGLSAERCGVVEEEVAPVRERTQGCLSERQCFRGRSRPGQKSPPLDHGYDAVPIFFVLNTTVVGSVCFLPPPIPPQKHTPTQ